MHYAQSFLDNFVSSSGALPTADIYATINKDSQNGDALTLFLATSMGGSEKVVLTNSSSDEYTLGSLPTVDGVVFSHVNIVLNGGDSSDKWINWSIKSSSHNISVQWNFDNDVAIAEVFNIGEGGGDCDLTSVLTAITTAKDEIKIYTATKSSENYNALNDKLTIATTNINNNTDTQIANISLPDIDLTALTTLNNDNKNLIITAINDMDIGDIVDLNFTSLNGSNGSIPDTTLVNIVGFSGDYTVSSSFMSNNDDTSYLLLYVVEKDSKKSIVPATIPN